MFKEFKKNPPGSKSKLDPDGYEARWKRICDEINRSDCSTIILSSEVFPELAGNRFSNSQSTAMIRWIGDQLKEFDVYVVCYLRPLGEFVKSRYKFEVRNIRVSLTMADWLNKQLMNNSIYIAPTRFLDSFADQFGLDRITLRKYNKSSLVNGNIIDDFFDLLGFPLNNKSPTEHDGNPSLPDEKVDMKRIFNASMASPANTTNRRIGNNISRLPVMTFGSRPADGGESIRNSLEKEHLAIADRYGLDLGEVSDPFAGTTDGSIENQGSQALMAMVWKEVHEPRKEIQKLREEIQELRAQNDKLASSKQIKKWCTRLENLILKRTSIHKRFKLFFGKLYRRFSAGSDPQRG